MVLPEITAVLPVESREILFANPGVADAILLTAPAPEELFA